MMRKSLVVVLFMTFVLVIASGAFAAPPASWNPPGPTYRDPALPPGPPTPDTPHGSYAATGDECEVCHSPHQAGGWSWNGSAWVHDPNNTTSYKLLRSATRDAACDYCHVGAGAKTAKVIYTDGGVVVKTGRNGHEIGQFVGGVPDANATVNIGPGNNTTIGSELDCFDCHSAHGAKALAADILKKDPANNGGADAIDQTGFCSDCHNRNYNPYNDYNNYNHLGESHPMGPGGPHSAAGTKYCDSCHSASTGGLYPHISTGDALLSNGTRRDQIDGSCVNACHGQVGINY